MRLLTISYYAQQAKYNLGWALILVGALTKTKIFAISAFFTIFDIHVIGTKWSFASHCI